MEEKKQETIAKLYSLRAGLSLLSKIYDKAKKELEVIDNSEYKIKNFEKEQQDLHNHLEYLYSQSVRPVQNEIKMLEGRFIPEYEIKIKKRRNGFFCCTLICLLILSLSVGATIFGFLGLLSVDGTGSIPLILGIAGIIASSVGCYLLFKSYIRVDWELYHSEKQAVSSPAQAVNPKPHTARHEFDPRIAIEERKLELEKKNKAYEEHSKEYEIKKSQIQSEIGKKQEEIEAAKAKLSLIKDYFKAVYAVLQEHFGDFFDEREWGNVDLIIFNYETGRALNFRDVLLQLDDERRHERLVQAVQYANISVCSGIEKELFALQGTFSGQIDVLDGKIAKLPLHASVLYEIGNAKQALADKKKTSSDILAEDLNMMSKLAEADDTALVLQ